MRSHPSLHVEHWRSTASVVMLALALAFVGTGAAADTAGPADEPESIQLEDYTDSAPRALVPDAPSATRWFNMPGATFLPHSNSVNWGYGGAGCLDPSTTGTWRAPLLLPDGAQISVFTFGYYNTSTAAGSTARLYRYTWDGKSVQLTSVTAPSGSVKTGYNYATATISPALTIDNWNNSYALVWDGSTTQELCYMQVGFSSTFWAVALPLIRR